jgi:protocatechuate 3,4-dioxygenase beta subunit
VSRPLLALLLLAALAATGYVGFLLLGSDDRGGRRDRDRTAIRGPERPPASPPPSAGAADEPPGGAPVGSWPLSGRVGDPAGRPVPDAVVRATTFEPRQAQLETRTDTSGRYELRLPGPSVTFDVSARGYLPLVGLVSGRSNGRLDHVCEGDGPWVRDFRLEPATTLTGRVRDESGGPVAGATVYVLSPEHQLVDRRTVANVVTSNREGAFVFPGLAPGTYDLGARARGFLPRVVRDVAIPERGEHVQEVVVARGRTIFVTVENDPVQGAPPLAPVTLVTAADSRLRGMLLPPGGVEALRDALVGRTLAAFPVVGHGRKVGDAYVCEGVGDGPADVWAEVHLMASSAPRLDRSYLTEPGLSHLLDTTEARLTLTLVPGVLIHLRVRHANTGQPLRPAVVRRTRGVPGDLPVQALTEDLAWVPRDDRSHSLHFTLEGFEPAELALPDLRPAAVVVAGLPRYPPPFDVAMHPTAVGETGAFYLIFEPALLGRVALIGRDAEGAQGWVRHLDTADDEGRWEAKGIPVGEYAVSVLATGMIPVILPRVVVTRTVKETHRVRLEPGGGLSFKVTDQEGKLLDRVHLLLADAAEKRIDVHVLTHVSEGRAFLSVNYLPSAATARADSGLAPGAYTLTAYKEGYAPATEAFTIRGREVAEVALSLPPR